jgi:lambda repressor-like predicted transcriptional regulator
MIEQETMPARPAWLPEAVRTYLEHTEDGLSLRALARRQGVAASTVMRQVRRYENRRDDPLVDAALTAFSAGDPLPRPAASAPTEKDAPAMSAPIRCDARVTDDLMLNREARRVLRRLAEPGAVLAIAPDMEKAAVLREMPDGRTARTGVVDRPIAQAFALKDWITCRKNGRVATYDITSAGRMALKRLLDADSRPAGLAEAATPFADQHRDWETRDIADEEGVRRMRYNLAESPVAALGRRRDKDGKAFLDHDLVEAAERLREDFELAQMGPRVAQNWDRFLTGGDRGGLRSDAGLAEGPRAARDRVAAALRDLGPGLGDMVLRCCCFLEGLEAAEKRMGWSARSGKIVLRIALQRLKRHYHDTYGKSGPLIG